MSLHEERLLPQIKRRNHNRFVARISILCGFCGCYLNGTCGLNRIEPGNTVNTHFLYKWFQCRRRLWTFRLRLSVILKYLGLNLASWTCEGQRKWKDMCVNYSDSIYRRISINHSWVLSRRKRETASGQMAKKSPLQLRSVAPPASFSVLSSRIDLRFEKVSLSGPEGIGGGREKKTRLPAATLMHM